MKAAHASIDANRKPAERLKLIKLTARTSKACQFGFQVHKVFCDDLIFNGNDASYKSLKADVESGGIEGRPDACTPPPIAVICWRAR